MFLRQGIVFMNSLLRLYLGKLAEYQQLQESLYATLEPLITLKPADDANLGFSLTCSSISEQIRNWPEREFLLPPAAWVQPRKGKVKLGSEEWEFIFHGAALSFIHSQTGQDITIEYSNTGHLGITEYTVLLFLERSADEPLVQKLLEKHTVFFNKLIEMGYLVKIPPLLPHDDQTFLLKRDDK
jgi:hypothetical protein